MSEEIEIERKWLVHDIPNLSRLKGKKIIQGYIAITADGTEIRVRQKDNMFYQTIKSDGGLVRREIEIELTQNQFKALWQATKGRRLQKTRYEIPINSMTIELDEYHGKLLGLNIAEIEFESISDSESFNPPAWLGQEVTMDQRYKNKILVLNGTPISSK